MRAWNIVDNKDVSWDHCDHKDRNQPISEVKVCPQGYKKPEDVK